VFLPRLAYRANVSVVNSNLVSLPIPNQERDMKKLGTLLTVGRVVDSTGCQRDRRSSVREVRSTVVTPPPLFVDVHQSFLDYFGSNSEPALLGMQRTL
jgi:hypothetical protein